MKLDYDALQDLCLIAITDGRPLPARAIAGLPPWRAVLLGRVAEKAGIAIEGGTLEELVAEAGKVGGEGKLHWPCSPPPAAPEPMPWHCICSSGDDGEWHTARCAIYNTPAEVWSS